MKISKGMWVFLIVVIILVILWVAELKGWISYTWIVTNIISFILAFIIIAVLAIIGALFMGTFFGYKLFTRGRFTPFEEEMLKMHIELNEIKTMLKEIEKKLKGKD